MQWNDTGIIFRPRYFERICKRGARFLGVFCCLYRFIPSNKIKLQFAVLICMTVQKIPRLSNLPSKERCQDAQDRERRKKTKPKKMERRSGILVNLKWNLDSMSSCLQVYIYRHGKTRSNLPNTFVPGVEKMIWNEYSSNGHKRHVLRMSDVWSISCSTKRDKRLRVSTQK